MGINPPRARAGPPSLKQKEVAHMSETTNSTTEDEFYDDATEAFPSKDDLAPFATAKNSTVGRLVAVWAVKNGTETNNDGKSYPWTETVTLVLDDGPDGDQFTDLVGPAPQKLTLRHSTAGLQSRFGPRVDGMTKPKRDEDGTIIAPAVPQKFRPMIGRINTRPSSKVKGGSPAFSISIPTDEDRVIVKRYEAEIREINQEQEAKAATAADAEAFE
jgi:hypothetical protein